MRELESKSKNNKPAPCIAVFGTGSDVGKSIVTTAICRLFAKRGLKVAPYKAQNMSNNSGITPEGLEMGRAQIVQAEAAGIPPHVDMNPILLKPTSQTGAQVVLLGEALENNTASEYHRKKEKLFSSATDSLDRLRRENDVVVIEGAGSCAEVNLMPHDIVNFRIAEYADAPVILVGDIHRGGIFGQFVGTLACISKRQEELIKGFIVNRFRGDISLFDDGVSWIEEKTEKDVLGVLPWYNHITIEAEDSVVIEKPEGLHPSATDKPSVAVLRLPHISNFTDFDALSAIEGINLVFVEKPADLSMYAAVIIPGSKNTCFDLNWVKSSGWKEELFRYSEQGGHLLGICGGYQMMGTVVHDPDGLEGVTGTTEGLGFLPVETTLKAPKTTTLTDFSWGREAGSGYEIHMGHTERTGGAPLLAVHARNGEPAGSEDGCIVEEGRVMGTYMHGFFDSPGITRNWLSGIGIGHVAVPAVAGLAARDLEYDALLEHFEQHVDIQKVLALAEFEQQTKKAGSLQNG